MITMVSKYPLKPDEFIKHGILAPNNFAPESRVSQIVTYTNISLVMLFRRKCSLISKIFQQKSTYSKEDDKNKISR